MHQIQLKTPCSPVVVFFSGGGLSGKVHVFLYHIALFHFYFLFSLSCVLPERQNTLDDKIFFIVC